MSTAAEAMLTDVKLCRADVTVGELRRFFADDHVHAAVLVADGMLVAVVERGDLAGLPAGRPAAGLGCPSRAVGPDTALADVLRTLARTGGRRLAVVAADGRFLGLLCLKRTRRGFCSDRDVRERACGRLAA